MTAELADKEQKKRRRRPEEVRQRVLEAATEAFAISGFDGASTRAIATDAGVSLPLLIYHFKSKEELWYEVVRGMVNATSLSDIIDQSTESATEQLRLIIHRMVTAFAEQPHIHRMMTLEAHVASERLSWMCETLIRRDFEALCKLIEKAQAEGAVRAGNPARLRYAIIGMASVPFAVSAEYQYLTKKNPFAKTEVRQTIELIESLIFTR